MSDSKITMDQLKEKVATFCEEREWDQFHGPKDLAIGLCTEAAELLEIFRFQSEKQSEEILNDPKKRKDIQNELADSLFFILRFAQRFNIDLTSSLAEKIIQSSKKYPIEKARGSNKKYTEL